MRSQRDKLLVDIIFMKGDITDRLPKTECRNIELGCICLASLENHSKQEFYMKSLINDEEQRSDLSASFVLNQLTSIFPTSPFKVNQQKTRQLQISLNSLKFCKLIWHLPLFTVVIITQRLSDNLNSIGLKLPTTE